MSKIGVMVCGHGSRDLEAITEFQSVAAGIEARLPQYPVASGFLEFARPIIRDGLDKLYGGGVRHILAIPGMRVMSVNSTDTILGTTTREFNTISSRP